MPTYCSRTLPIFIFLAYLALASSARADVAAPPPLVFQMVTAETIVVGTVIGFADQDVLAKPYPQSKQKVPYRIALVRVSKGIQGSKQGKVIRVGYLAPPKPVVNQPKKLVFPSSRRPTMQLKVGQQALLFLKKHPVESFLIPPGYYSIKTAQPKTPKHFNQYVHEVQRMANILANPIPALKSQDDKIRVQAATLLIAKYRQPPFGRKFKQVPVDAEENKLILNALANADWSKYNNYSLLLQAVDLLGLTPKDGFVRPKRITSPKDYPNAVRNWLKTHANTYRMKRLVPIEPDTK